ncbi:biotin/lipoyl-containing protein [Anatilimnocola sp. NA78]|uniref:biotin/lipoyl-containing protein n=1 Tax=Anatilimnocola sp. NA78 TaxID=3415683 RepID=UPI003CE49F6E
MPQVPLLLTDLDLGDIPVLACSWLVDQGARVVQGDRLLEVVAGEVTVDLAAPASGRLIQRCVGPEQQLTIGQVLAVIHTADSPSDDR